MSISSPDVSLPHAVDDAMQAFAKEVPRLPLAIAYSGGADSSCLLLQCAARWPGQVQAWHVNHGLQAAAAEFERHCSAECQRLDVPLHVQRVDARAGAGQSPEAVARRQRYAAFMALAGAACARGAPVGTVLLAQHADDQIETVLLALSRGAGLPGLAAMPARWRREGVDYARPLLGLPSVAIRQWLRARGAVWIEDETNQDDAFTRNRIRKYVLPALQTAFGDCHATFARSAAHAAQAQAVLQEVAASDLAVCGVPPQIARLQALSQGRCANVLRHWLHVTHGQQPSAAQLAQLMHQINACRTRGHQVDIKVGQGHVRRDGLCMVWQPMPVGSRPLK